MFWNPITSPFEMNRYLKNIVDDLVIICDKIINVLNTES